ncbi:MAG: hypothetical protein MUQ32_02880 [Chloroflexi bacterium]|nr:hypothetical protein [Chloroflexota bacterium]
MNWFKRQPGPAVRVREPHARPLDEDTLLALAFACTTCGRTDLPEAGDWNPPICQECDAAINEDTIREELDSSPDDAW